MRTPLDIYLTERALTGRDIAERVGVSEQTLSKLRRGRRLPTLEQALRISAATGGAVPVEAWADPGLEREAS